MGTWKTYLKCMCTTRKKKKMIATTGCNLVSSDNIIIQYLQNVSRFRCRWTNDFLKIFCATERLTKQCGIKNLVRI